MFQLQIKADHSNCGVVYSEVVSCDEFLNLPLDHVSKLIADDQLSVSSEEQVSHSFRFLIILHYHSYSISF